LHEIAEKAKADDYREVVMTIAEQLRREGEKKGILEGIQKGKIEGIQEGIEKGKRECEKQASMNIACQMLESGIDRKSIMKFTGLTEPELRNLFKD